MMSLRATALLLTVTTIGCAAKVAPPRAPRWQETLASQGWASALISVAHDCGNPEAPKDACPEGDLDAGQRMYDAREEAYKRLLATYPVHLEIGVATRDEMATLTGYPMPPDADEHAMVVTCRVRLPTMPARVTWVVSSASAFLTRDIEESVVYSRDADEDAEDFVVALGGAPRPSTLAYWKRSTPFASFDEYRSYGIADQDRYGIPYPTKMTPVPSPEGPTLTQQVASSDSTGLVSLGAAPVTVLLDVLNLFGPSAPGRSPPEHTEWVARIHEKRAAENVEWARDPHVAALVRLWDGAWNRPRTSGATVDEVLVTYGYEVHRPRPNIDSVRPAAPPMRYKNDGALMLVLHPVVDRMALPEISVTVEVPRFGDLLDDLEAFALTGPHLLEPWSGKGVGWKMIKARCTRPSTTCSRW